MNANGGKISFGGSAEDSYTFIVSDATVSLAGYSSHTDRTGYTLTGWKASETETYDVDKNIVPSALSGDLTLQAQWEPKKYTVRLKVDESDSSVQEIKTTYDSSELSTVSYSTPAKEGHVLTGWAVKNGPRVITVNENGKLSLAAGVAGYTDSDGKWTRDVADNVLYAQWKQGYWLSLYNGESSLVYSEAIGSGTAGLDSGYAEAIHGMSYGEGWELDGWYTAKSRDSGQKVLDADGRVVNAVAGYSKLTESGYVLELSENKSLYACWKRTSTVYALTDSLTPGESYLIVNTDAAGNGVAFGRKYGYNQTNVQVEIKTGSSNEKYIETDKSDKSYAVFKCTEDYALGNSDAGTTGYIQLATQGDHYEGHNLITSEGDATKWQYHNNLLYGQVSDSQGDDGYFYYNSNGWFTAYCSKKNPPQKVYLYQQLKDYAFVE